MVVALFLVPALAGIAAFFIRPHGPRRVLLPAVAVAHASLTSLAWLRLPAPALQGLLKLDELGLLFLTVGLTSNRASSSTTFRRPSSSAACCCSWP